MQQRFVRLELKGRGAMAEVYRGRLGGEAHTGRLVALKCLRPEVCGDPRMVDLFVREARWATQVSHPNIAQALELVRGDDGYTLICEWLEGASLADIVGSRGPLPPAALLVVAEAVGAALSFLHGWQGEDGVRGLVHRDVTPSNVFVCRSGDVKLADLGVVAPIGEVRTVAAGTTDFAAPEQLAGAAPDVRADVHGLAATLAAVAGGLPAPLAEVLSRGRAADPEARPPTIAAFVEELRVAAAAAGLSASRAALVDHLPVERPAPRLILDGAVQAMLAPALSTPGRVASAPAVRRRPASFRVATAVLVSLGALGAFWGLRPRAVPDVAQPAESIPTSRPSIAPAARPAAPRLVLAPKAAAVEVVRRDSTDRPPLRSPPEVDKPRGTLSINAQPWAEVRIDGQGLGNTPLREVSLVAGPHVIELHHPPEGLRQRVDVEVRAGVARRLIVDLRKGRVDVSGSE